MEQEEPIDRASTHLAACWGSADLDLMFEIGTRPPWSLSDESLRCIEPNMGGIFPVEGS